MSTEPPPERADASSSVVGDPRFRRMLGAKFCVDIAENALAYALLIVIVRHTGSGIHSTLFVIALTIPTIIFGIPAVAIADRLPKRPVLMVALALRIGLTALLIRVLSNV